MNLMIWAWLGAVVIFGVTELLTEGMVSIWFAAGALAALAAALLNAPVAVQVMTFALVSAAAVFLSRPYVRRFMERPGIPTNADRVIGGRVKKNGKTVKITKPIDAMKNGIAYLPEDRKVDGIVGDLSVRENIILALQVLKGFFRPFTRAEANKFAEEYIKLLEIKTASADTPIKSLSGGNQQKVILARWLLANPEYLILDEPTRGIDVGTKIEIQKLVLKLASEGMSVTFISSETDEMLRTCSRLIVMRDRKVVGELSGEDLTQNKIMNTIAGGEEE